MQKIQYTPFPSKRRFGIELEVSNNLGKWDLGALVERFESTQRTFRTVEVEWGIGNQSWSQTHSNDYWHVKYDSTCGPKGKGFDNGWEIASFIGKGRKDLFHIAEMAQYLKQHGATTNKNCGLHIHVEASDFTELSMGILLARWLKIEPFLLLMAHPSRSHNIHCQSLRVFHGIELFSGRYFKTRPDYLWETLRPRNLAVHNNWDRRVTLNTVNFATGLTNSGYRRKTVELRLPECCLEEDHVKFWAMMFLRFVESSCHAEMPDDFHCASTPEEILHFLGLESPDNFLILDEDLATLRVWVLKKLHKKVSMSLSPQILRKLEYISQI